MNYHNITYLDIENGIDLRVTLWVSGCNLHCEGCHNGETWDFNSGVKFDAKAKNKLFKILELDYVDGITFSGGNPLDHADTIKKLSDEIATKYPTKTQWLYSGYTWEEILIDPKKINAIQNIDVVVDGRFDQAKRDITLPFKGSSNQRIIDVPKSLESGHVVLWDADHIRDVTKKVN